MTQNNVLAHLDAARRSHIKWLNRAKTIVEGKNLVRDPHPLKSTECQFGLWFNGEGEALYKVLQIDGEKTIHTLHGALHEKYLNIYEIYFGSAEGVIYDSKVRLEKNRVSPSDDATAKELMHDLRKLSYEMLDLIIHLENSVKDSDKFD